MKDHQSTRNNAIWEFIKYAGGVILCVGILGIISHHYEKNYTKPVVEPEATIDVSRLIQADLDKNKDLTFEEFEEIVKSLPDCPIKRNLLIVIAAHYSGATEELNSLLEEYAKFKIKQIENTQ